ncbi:MAG: extracellular solute-binding protein [Ignavibacteriaceae bacterium]
MKFEKIFYVAISVFLVTTFVLVSYIFPPYGTTDESLISVKKIYYADYISPAHQALINLFNERYKGQIEVVGINLPFEKFSTNERKELLARYLRSKSDRIDIFAVDQIWVPRFARWGIPLDKLISQQQKDNLLKYSMETCSYNGQIVALPLYIDVALMYYRKDLLRQLPDYRSEIYKLSHSITWKDFIALHERLKEKNPFFLFQADDYEGLICSFDELMESQGKSFIENGKVQLNSPEAKRALQLLVNLVNKYKMSPTEVTGFKEDPSYKYYLKNDGVFLRGWPGFLTGYKADPEYKDKFNNIFRAPTPHFEDGRATSVFGGWNLMISKFSNNVPEAAKFINFVTSEEAQKLLYEKGGFLPINNLVYDDTAFLNQHKSLYFFKDLLKQGVHRPFMQSYTGISDVISYYLHGAIKKQFSVSDALNMATEKINSGNFSLK